MLPRASSVSEHGPGPVFFGVVVERSRRVWWFPSSPERASAFCFEQISRVSTLGRRKMEEPAGEEDDQDGLSAHSAGQAPPSSASSLPKEHSQVELELRVLEALEIYPPFKLQGVHRHFVLYGLMEFLQKSFDQHFTADEVLQLLDRFFNLEMLKPDDDETEPLNQEEDFSLPQSFFVKEEP